MSNLLDFDRGGGWNYSDPAKPNYMPSITGTVVAIEEVQSTNWKTGQPEFFDPFPGQVVGNPKLNIQLIIQGQSGNELPWQFMPKKGSNAFDAVVNALRAYNPESRSIANIGGLMIRVSTQYTTAELGKNARPWQVEILGPGNAEFRGITEFDMSKVQQPVMQQPVMQQPVMQQPVMQQPMMQGGQPVPSLAQMQSMGMYGQATPPSPLNRNLDGGSLQQMQQPMQQVSQSMQQAPHMAPQQQQQFAQQQQVPNVDPNTGLYDEDIPF